MNHTVPGGRLEWWDYFRDKDVWAMAGAVQFAPRIGVTPVLEIYSTIVS